MAQLTLQTDLEELLVNMEGWKPGHMPAFHDLCASAMHRLVMERETDPIGIMVKHLVFLPAQVREWVGGLKTPPVPTQIYVIRELRFLLNRRRAAATHQ